MQPSLRISLTCECCKRVFDLPKTDELPAHVFALKCNYCIECDDAGRMEDYYYEWWDENDNDPEKGPLIPVGDNQLCMPFIMDEIGIKETQYAT